MNIWDILILLALGAAVVLAFRYIRRHGGDCGDCACCSRASDCKKKTDGR